MVFRIPLLILPGMDFRFRDVMKEAENPDNGWMNIQPPNQGAHFINARLMKAQVRPGSACLKKEFQPGPIS